MTKIGKVLSVEPIAFEVRITVDPADIDLVIDLSKRIRAQESEMIYCTHATGVVSFKVFTQDQKATSDWAGLLISMLNERKETL